MEIVVELNLEEGVSYARAVDQFERHNSTEEEFHEELIRILGPKLKTKPQEGDHVRIIVQKKVAVVLPGTW